MWACLTSFRDGLSLLRHHLDGLDKQDALLNVDPGTCDAANELIADLQSHCRRKNNKSQYDYNMVIVSLYGYLERYIEDLIGEHLDQVVDVVARFSDLPASVQEKHLPLSLELARKADRQKYESSARPDEIISKLHSCYASPDKYNLNVLAFAQHSANFRQSVITQTFAQCGIADVAQGVKQSEPFISFLRKENPELDVNLFIGKENDVVFSRLNDLAERRNDVAHGSIVDEILSRDILREYVDFVEAYAEGLGLFVFERTLPFMLPSSVRLGTAIEVIDNRIVCVNLLGGEISVGDMIIARTQDTRRPYKGGPIREIQRENISLEKITGGPGVQIAMLVDFGAKQNHEFYCFQRSD